MITAENRHEGNISTIYEKLDEARRRKLDAAIIRRDPRTEKAIYEKFKLAESGISYDVLYRYTRRVRDDADKLSFLEKTLADEVDIPGVIEKHIRRQALEILMHQDPNMLDLHRASLTMHKCVQTKAAVANLPDLAPEASLSHEDRIRNLNKLANQIFGCSLPGLTKSSSTVSPDEELAIDNPQSEIRNSQSSGGSHDSNK